MPFHVEYGPSRLPLGLAPTLSLPLVRKMIRRTVTVRPIRIIRKCNGYSLSRGFVRNQRALCDCIAYRKYPELETTAHSTESFGLRCKLDHVLLVSYVPIKRLSVDLFQMTSDPLALLYFQWNAKNLSDIDLVRSRITS